MNLFDSARPRLSNGLPMYPHERPLAAVPSLTISFSQSGSPRVSVMLAIEPNRYQWFEQVTTFPIEPLMADWVANPEETMRIHFAWHCQFTIPKKREPIMSLEDLGL